MHYYETIEASTFAIFLQEIEELKNKGYDLTRTSTNKRVIFDGKNTIEAKASVSAILEKGTATLTVICAI